MTEYYYLNSRNQPQGPHSLDDLAGLMASGRVNPTTLVACKGAGSWEPLGSLLSRENIAAPEVTLAPGQAGSCPTCGHDLTGDMVEGQLPARCATCGRSLRPESSGIWANYMLALRNYFKFSGRATRAEYWCFQLINLVIYLLLYIGIIIPVVAGILHLAGMEDREMPESTSITDAFQTLMADIPWAGPLFLTCGGLLILFSLAIIIPSISVSFRRLHDIGRSGWWLGASFLLSLLFNIISYPMQKEIEAAEESGALMEEAALTPYEGFVLLGLIICYGYSIFLFILTLLDSQRGNNKYGPSAKYPLG